jgi:hypothetical protein
MNKQTSDDWPPDDWPHQDWKDELGFEDESEFEHIDPEEKSEDKKE